MTAQVVDLTPAEIQAVFQKKNELWDRLKKRIDSTGKAISGKKVSDASPECQKLGQAELGQFGYIKHICDKCLNPQFVGDDLEQKRYVQARINDQEDILIKQYEKNPSSIKGRQPTKTDFTQKSDFKKPDSPVQEQLEEVIQLKKELTQLESKLDEQRTFNATILDLHKESEKKIADLQAKVDGLAGSN